MHTLNSSACTQSEMFNNFVIMLSEENNIHAHPQTHVATNSLQPHVTSRLAKVHHTTPRGFEPLRAEPNGHRVLLLNRSDTVSCREGKIQKAMPTRRRWIRDSSAPMSAYVPSAPRYILCVDATAPCTWTYTQTHTQTTRLLGTNMMPWRDN